MQPILVTGCAGFVGFHFVKACLEKGFEVIGVDNLDAFYDPKLKEKNIKDLETCAKQNGIFRFYKKDIQRISKEDLSKVKRVFHLAAKAGVAPSLVDPVSYEETNVKGTLHLIHLCKEMGIEEFIFSSSSSVYGKTSQLPFVETAMADSPLSPYAASKRSAELFCQTYANLFNMKFAVLRFFTVYGPRQRPDLAIHKFARQMTLGETITLYEKTATGRDYTFVLDIVDGLFKAGNWLSKQTKPACEIFNLGSGRLVTPQDLVGALERVMGQKAKIQNAARLPQDMAQTLADLSKSQKVLNYYPTTALEKGIQDFYDWYCDVIPLSSVQRAA